MDWKSYIKKWAVTYVVAAVAYLLAFLVGVCTAEPPVRIIPIEEERELNAMLPTVEHDSLGRRVITSDQLIWYTDKEMSPAYQLQNTYHSPLYNVSSENEQDLRGNRIGRDRVGNGNRDFPWVATAGTDNCENVEIFRFVKLPKDDDGKVLPIVYFTGPNPGSGLRNPNANNFVLGEGGGTPSAQRWLYPKGTTFGELMCMHGPDDMLYPFELRMRFREDDFWEVDVYRPFPQAKDCEKAVKFLRPEWWSDDNLVHFISALRNPKVVKDSIQDRNRNVTAFKATFGKHELPPVNDYKLVAQLLTTNIWKSAHGVDWAEGVHAPTAPKGSKFHIVPEEYAGHVTAVDSQSCARCHEHTGHNVRVFDQNRGWYGRVRGQDRIFTFHPIAPSSISYNGENRQIRLRPEFVKAGIVEMYDPAKHSSALYKQLKVQ